VTPPHLSDISGNKAVGDEGVRRYELLDKAVTSRELWRKFPAFFL
jgi:hypothetical protein